MRQLLWIPGVLHLLGCGDVVCPNQDRIYDDATDSCLCRPPLVENEAMNDCICPTGTVRQGSECTRVDGGIDAAADAGTDGGDAAVDSGEPCVEEGATRPCPGGTDIGECEAGNQTCRAGEWSSCEGNVGPTTLDLCDGLDNDCDDSTDEDNLCPLVDGTDGEEFCDGCFCDEGRCFIQSCTDEYCDCDETYENGCEVAIIGTDPDHCGRCGRMCEPGEFCNGGDCF